MKKIIKKTLLTITIIMYIFLISSCKLLINKIGNNDSSNNLVESSFVENKEILPPENSSNEEIPIQNEQIGEVSEQIVRIVNAYKSNDNSLLNDKKDIYILDSAKRVISKIINADMLDFEKEKVIHDYIIKNCQYDTDHMNELSNTDADSYNPYGFFKNGKTVCLGYTQTFQLFMDLLDIKCITIHSTALGGEEHAWNMVELEGEWYHVDVTWDDPIPDGGDRVIYNFFNVTSEYMKDSGHEWDESKYPKANATKYSMK